MIPVRTEEFALHPDINNIPLYEKSIYNYIKPVTHLGILEKQQHNHRDVLQQFITKTDDHAMQVLPHSRVQQLSLSASFQPVQKNREGLGTVNQYQSHAANFLSEIWCVVDFLNCQNSLSTQSIIMHYACTDANNLYMLVLRLCLCHISFIFHSQADLRNRK